MSLLTALRDRWDLDPETQAAMPFDRAVAVVNMRRIEIASLLALLSDTMTLYQRPGLPALWLAMPLTILFALASRRMQHWRSLRAMQTIAVLVFAIRLLDSVWVSAEIAQSGRLPSGFAFNLLSLTMMFVLPPRMLAGVIAGTYTAFVVTVLMLPVPPVEKFGGIVNTGLVAIIAQVAGWLIHLSRRRDHEQKQLIRAQNARLTEQNDELDRLMAITAHDLRSPLYGLRNLLDFAARNARAKPDAVPAALRDAVSGLDEMIALVSRLLDAHSAEHAPLGSDMHEDLRRQLLAAARRIAPASEAAGVEVEVDLPERPILARFDGHALARILDNLLDNAVRFSPAGGRLRLCCVARGDEAVVEIEDQGPGFDAAGEAAMFGKFHQRGDAERDAKAGAGMGLFIAATFAARMKAVLSYARVEPTGARFTLRFRAEPAEIDPPVRQRRSSRPSPAKAGEGQVRRA